MLKRAVALGTGTSGTIALLLAAFSPPALARLSPAATPSSLATSSIPPQYLTLYMRAARSCPGLPWQVLAAIGEIESDDGRSPAQDVHGPSGFPGPEGPMQFEPATFAEYAVRADKGRPVSPYDPADAVYTGARMLCADGGGSPDGVEQAIYSYNHAWWYVSDVMTLAQKYSGPVAQEPASRKPGARKSPIPPASPTPTAPVVPTAPATPTVRPTPVTRISTSASEPPSPSAPPSPPSPSPSPSPSGAGAGAGAGAASGSPSAPAPGSASPPAPASGAGLPSAPTSPSPSAPTAGSATASEPASAP